jgi:predicted metalloprotease with PDZ domain
MFIQVLTTNRPAARQTGIDVRVVNGQALVTAVDKDSPAAKAGVRTGWRILQVDEKDVAPSIESISHSYSDSTLRELMLARAIYRLEPV